MSLNRYSGIVPPLITPLKSQNELDIPGLERLIEYILDGGVHGLFILGTTGEGPSLSYKIRLELIERVCKQVNNRVPILVGITDTSIIESLYLAKKAYDFGADSVVAAPPYYFSTNQMELKRYFHYLADESPLPLLLYNMPSHTKTKFEPKTVYEISSHPNIVGFKDSSGDVIYFQKVLHLFRDNPDFSILVGPEEILMQAILSGGHGGVNGGANMFPKLYVKMYEAAKRRDFQQMIPLQKKILQISTTLYTIGDSPVSYLQGVKSALSIMGICNDVLATPFKSFGKKEKEIIEDSLKKLNVGNVKH